MLVCSRLPLDRIWEDLRHALQNPIDAPPLREIVNPDFIVNAVPNFGNQIAGIFAGNWVSAWLEAAKMVDQMYGVEIGEEADIVIGTAGGYPMDISLY